MWGRREGSALSTDSKISVRWLGPYRVLEEVSPWHYKLESLTTGDIIEAHSSRIKYYADATLSVSEELTSYVASHAATGYRVNEILACRKQSGVWELQVDWSGFTELDRTWEPAQNLIEDVPKNNHHVH